MPASLIFEDIMSDNIPAATNGTELRLDILIAEMRACRKRIEDGCPQPPQAEADTVPLREPAPAQARLKRGR